MLLVLAEPRDGGRDAQDESEHEKDPRIRTKDARPRSPCGNADKEDRPLELTQLSPRKRGRLEYIHAPILPRLCPILLPSVEYALHRTAYLLVGTVNAAYPAARAAHAVLQFRNHTPHMILPCLFLLHRNRPTDPFVARERREALPQRAGFRVALERLLVVARQLVRDAAGNLF